MIQRLLLILLLAPALVMGQLPTRKEMREVRQITRDLEQEYDVVLDPIEQIGIAPRSMEAYDAGNWGNVALEIAKYYETIVERAQRPIHVYIFDTAGKWGHDALKYVEQPGATFTAEPDPMDGNGHSTHCAGIIGGVTDFPLGIARGLIEKNLLKLYPVKVLLNSGAGNYSSIEKAILWANEEAKKKIKDGHFVIYSFSLGGSASSTSVNAALAAAKQLGVFIVAASGNTGGRGVNFPGSSPSSKAIGSLTNTDPLTRSNFSTTGPEVWIGMPGQEILSSYKGNSYATLSGTSMATPHAAGIAAIAASVYPAYSADEIAALLEKVSTDLAPAGRDENTGYGVDLVGNILAYSGGTPKPDPNPEPPKPVDPVKPEREQVFGFSEPFTVVWGKQGSNTWSNLTFYVTIAWKNTKTTESARATVKDFVYKHFTNRGYYLFADSDERDALYWVAYFAEMIAKKEAGLSLEVTSIQSAFAPALIYADPIQGKPTVAKANRAKAFYFTRVE